MVCLRADSARGEHGVCPTYCGQGGSLNALLALRKASRPLFLFGWGVRLAGAEDVARRLVEVTGVPVVTTWAAADMFPQAIGSFGTHGVRAANFAVQNADLIISVGSRLDTKATGSPASGFAPKARIIMVDIDESEIGKMEKIGRPVEGVRRDAKEFLSELLSDCVFYAAHDINNSTWGYSDWTLKVEGWKAKYPAGDVVVGGINPYSFVRDLGKYLTAEDVIVSDTGCSLGWMMQGYQFKGERFIHAFNQTPMGYGLPASIGAAFATGRRVICITGNGGLSVNVTEMATVKHHELPIKIILFENYSHSMCMQTQRQWLKGEYPATSEAGGLACPDFEAVAHAYGISVCLDEQALFDERWKSEPGFLQLEIDPEQGLSPQARFGCALEDQEPMLPREELAQIMEAA